MSLATRQLRLPKELRETILSKKCVAFIGSGPSTGSYASWPDLVNGLCEHCGSSVRVTSDSPADDFLDAAEDAKTANESEYYYFLGEHFGRPADKASLLYDVLLTLPFECFLTVNLDPLLALKSRTVRNSGNRDFKSYPSLDRKAMVNGSIHYLHGYIGESTPPTRDTIVFSRSEFEAAYANNSNLMNLLIPTLENDPIVFVGCQLREPVMTQVFAICKMHQQKRMKVMMELGQGNPRLPSRFIFLPKPEVKDGRGELSAELSRDAAEEKKQYYLEKDIQPIWYPAPGNDHSALRYALEELAEIRPIAPSHGWGGNLYAT